MSHRPFQAVARCRGYLTLSQREALAFYCQSLEQQL
jgi:hypothetical protein